MKILRSKSINGIIYAILLSLPFLAILGRVAYTVANKNAKDSYSGEENAYVETPITNVNQLELNSIYHFNSEQTFTNTSTQNTDYISFSDISDIYTNNQSVKTRLESAYYFRFYYSATTKEMYTYDETLTTIGSNNITNSSLQFNFRLLSYNSLISQNLSMFSKLDIENQSYMDNAFEYSVSQFVSENDFGELNLFSWFGNLLLSNNAKNMLYIHFVNWYLNYAIFVSLINILFLVIMWFVNYCRRLLERGMNYDW